MKTLLSRLALFLCVVALVAAVPAVRAQDLTGVRARMAERLPVIDQMKAEGIIGENNRGLVEARITTLSAGQNHQIVAENYDRKTVYTTIAQKTSTPEKPVSPEDVARARAKQIAENSKPGVWIQRDNNGEWYRK